MVAMVLIAPLGRAVSAHPNPTGGLPVSNVLQQLVNGAEDCALAIALLGAFGGTALWTVAPARSGRSTRSSHPETAVPRTVPRRRRRPYADPAYDMQGRPKQPPTSLRHGKIADS